jgi:3D (Asp-Asp-Asp) domain-containing protein
MSTTGERIGRTRFGVIAAVAFALALFGMLVPELTAPAAASTAALPACQFWSDVTPPERPVSPWIPPLQTSPAVNFTQRLPAPTGVTGSLAGGRVAVTFNRVPGAQSYRLWRNGQPIAWLLGYDQPTITITDTAPCQNAYYSVIALADQSATDESTGRLSTPYQLNANGVVVPWVTPVGRTIDMLVTAYNDTGTTASGYRAQLGVCAVDPRVVPWGTYFSVPGYGICYSADIGTWIQNDTVDVWLPPGVQANNWGVQNRTITIIANPYTGTPPPQ